MQTIDKEVRADVKKRCDKALASPEPSAKELVTHILYGEVCMWRANPVLACGLSLRIP